MFYNILETIDTFDISSVPAEETISFDIILGENLCHNDQFTITVPGELDFPSDPYCELDESDISCDYSDNDLLITLQKEFISGTLVISPFVPPHSDTNVDFNCAIDSVNHISSYTGNMGSFSAISFTPTSNIVSETTSYVISLTPEMEIDQYSTIILTFPFDIIFSSCLIADSSASCNVDSQNVIISELLDVGSHTADTELLFTIEGIINPSYTLKEVDNNFEIEIQLEGATTFLGEEVGPEYQEGTFESISISPKLQTTDMTTVYEFSLITSKPVPADSIIEITYPGEITATDSLESKSGPNGFIDYTASIEGSQTIIADAFQQDANQNEKIAFDLQNIVNPVPGSYDFEISIYFGDILQLIETSQYSIVIHPQMTVGLSSNSYENDALADFTFTLTSGDNALIFEEHYEVVLTIPEEISSCEIATLVTSSPLLTDLTKDSRDETEYYFFIELDNASSTRFIEPERADTTPVDSIEFKLTCINPPSLEPISSFSVHLLDLDSNTVTYGEYENYATQTASPFSVKSLVLEHEYPRVEAEYTFSITPNTEVFDSIIVSMTGAVVGETPSCSIISGLTGTIACAFNGNDVVITGIGSASETEASFSIDSYTNPADTTLFTATITTYTGGYLIQEGDLNYEMPCNYPCQSCDDSYPDQCTQCFQSDEYVFSPQEMYFYQNQCFEECPDNTTNIDPICYPVFQVDLDISDKTQLETASYEFTFNFVFAVPVGSEVHFEFDSNLELPSSDKFENDLMTYSAIDDANVVTFITSDDLSGEQLPITFTEIQNPVILIYSVF